MWVKVSLQGGGECGQPEGLIPCLEIPSRVRYNLFVQTKRTRHAVYQINYHMVWCPKFRHPVLAGEVGQRLAELIPRIVAELGGEVLDLTVMADHVHLFVSFPPTIAINQIMYRIKGSTSHQLRKEFPALNSRLPSLWTRSYYAGTAGQVSAETIQRYIEAQQGR